MSIPLNSKYLTQKWRWYQIANNSFRQASLKSTNDVSTFNLGLGKVSNDEKICQLWFLEWDWASYDKKSNYKSVPILDHYYRKGSW